MPDEPDRNQQAARDLLRQRMTRPSLRELIIRILAEAEGQTVNGQVNKEPRR